MLDSSNWDLTYRRNYLRHDLLPRIEELNPQFKRNVKQLAEQVKADEAFLEQQAEEAWNEILIEHETDRLYLDRPKWTALPLSLQRRTLRRAVRALRTSAKNISYQTIDQAQKVAKQGKTGAEVTLPGKLTLRVGYDVLVVESGSISATINQPQLFSDGKVVLPIPGSAALASGWQITSKISPNSLSRIRRNRDPWCAYVDVGDIQTLWVRSRLPGERFQPLGMEGRTASLQDQMVNLKLPAHLRSRWPVVVTEEHPIWLVGYHVDERAKVSDSSRIVVQLVCKQKKG